MRPSLIAMLAAAGLAWTAGASGQPAPDATAPRAPATTASVTPPSSAAAGMAVSSVSSGPQTGAPPIGATPTDLTSASAPPAGVTPAPLTAETLTANATLASTTGTAVNAQSANAPGPAAPPAKPAKKRLSWEQRFAQANTTGDGRLTLEQAKAGYVTVARHFKEIDLDAKGWVTTDDIRAWHKARRAARSAPKAATGTGTGTGTAAGETLRPQPAYHRSFPNAQQGTNADPIPGPVDGAKPEDPS